ncbi:MAG TPA: hypothetical protein VJ801_04620, partial [Polyangia bacterium]|nr:hypothetical protein [Polyangia bacterium]
MKRAVAWVPILAALACAGCFPASVGVAVPIGPGYEEAPPPPPPAYVDSDAQLYVPGQPPPPAMEYAPPAPGPGYAWIQG